MMVLSDMASSVGVNSTSSSLLETRCYSACLIYKMTHSPHLHEILHHVFVYGLGWMGHIHFTWAISEVSL